MTAVLGILLALAALFLLYYSSILLNWFCLVREYRSAKNKETYFALVEARHKKCREGRKKNLLLYLSILALRDLEKNEEAEKLLPFLKEDFLLGIKK